MTTAAIEKHGGFTAEWLMRQHFEPIEYVVPGIIPEGMTLVVAAPKVGKSWLVLGLGLALGEGTAAFGSIAVGKPRPVLYLALEDGQRRLLSRLQALDARPALGNLQFITELKTNVLDVIRDFLAEHDGQAPVVIVDVLAKVMPQAVPGEAAYERDYRVGGALKRAVDTSPGASLLIVHHTRKATAEDFTDSVSGTNGLAGSADTIAVLKRDRMGKTATLSVTSRDALEGEYGLKLEDNGQWVLNGTDLSDAAATARTTKATAGVGDRMAEVIATVNKFPEGVTPKNLGVLLPEIQGIAEYLRRAHDAGRIAKFGRGLYGPVTSVTNVITADFTGRTHTHHTNNTPNGAS